jgi:hypothetical protein
MYLHETATICIHKITDNALESRTRPDGFKINKQHRQEHFRGSQLETTLWIVSRKDCYFFLLVRQVVVRVPNRPDTCFVNLFPITRDLFTMEARKLVWIRINSIFESQHHKHIFHAQNSQQSCYSKPYCKLIYRVQSKLLKNALFLIIQLGTQITIRNSDILWT